MRRNGLWSLFDERRLEENGMRRTEVNVLRRISAARRRDGENLFGQAGILPWTFLGWRDALKEEKRYDPNDPTLKFVDTEDELDFLCEGFRSRKALMSCGHAVTPTSLTNWCLKQLDEGRRRFVCGQTGCNVEWSYEEVCKMALLTPEEKKLFEKAMSYNAGHASCSVNNGCCNESIKTLKKCPEMLLDDVKCPSIRACPTCGILQQHDSRSCKNVDCPRCKKYFCFVCLSVTLLHQCSVAAPRQTSVPVWKKE